MTMWTDGPVALGPDSEPGNITFHLGEPKPPKEQSGWFIVEGAGKEFRFRFAPSGIELKIGDGLAVDGAAQMFLEAVRAIAEIQGFQVLWPRHPQADGIVRSGAPC